MTDKITNEEMAVIVLEMMGYQKDTYSPGWYRKGGSGWSKRTALSSESAHTFAAEVMDFMMKLPEDEKGRHWKFDDLCTCNGGDLSFWRHGGLEPFEAGYADMNGRPRAVCEAAYAALKAEKESHEA